MLSGLEGLWREYLNDDKAVERRRKYFRWLAEGNPLLDGDSPYYLLLDGDRVIGMHGHMPQLLSVNGVRQRFYLAHDDLLAAECRGKGLGKVMLGGVAEQNRSFAGALWHNTPNLKLYAKCGWTDCSALVSSILVIDPRRSVQKRLGRNPLTHVLSFVLRQALAVRNALRRTGRSSAYRVTEIARFDERYDALFERTAGTLGIAVVRNATYLNWKFVDKPDNRYRRFAAFDSTGELRAYAVVSHGEQTKEPVGKVLDFLGEPQHLEALDVVIRRGLEWLKSQGVVEATCVGSPRALACLGRFGFRQRPSETGFMFIHWDPVLDREFVSDIGNWYITASDADGDAWKPT
jgi:GNAT superfamily N-acetyltransferase